MQCLSIAYRLWVEKQRVLTKAVICHKKVALKWGVALKQAGREQASKHVMPSSSKKNPQNLTNQTKKYLWGSYNGSQELIWVGTNQSNLVHFCYGLQMNLLSSKAHPKYPIGTFCDLLSPRRCWTSSTAQQHCTKCHIKHQFYSHFLCYKRTWIFFFYCYFLTEQLISWEALKYLFPLSLGHYLISLLHLQPELTSSGSQFC